MRRPYKHVHRRGSSRTAPTATNDDVIRFSCTLCRMVCMVDAVIVLIFLLVCVFLVTGVAQLFFRTPFVRTSPAVARAMVKLAKLKARETAVDIGAGDAAILLAAERSCSRIRARGYEIGLGIWMMGKLRTLLTGSNVRLLWRDGLKASVRDADVVFLYLGSNMMKECAVKFDKELARGTRVVSNTFRFHDRKPLAQKIVSTWTGKKKIYLYKW